MGVGSKEELQQQTACQPSVERRLSECGLCAVGMVCGAKNANSRILSAISSSERVINSSGCARHENRICIFDSDDDDKCECMFIVFATIAPRSVSSSPRLSHRVNESE